jgi:hypothetical protein
MSTINKSRRVQGQETGGSASTSKDRTNAGVKKVVSNHRPTKAPTAADVRPQTSGTALKLDAADYEAARILFQMQNSVPDSDSTISAPNSSPPSPNIGRADNMAAQILFEIRRAVPDSDSTITAPNLSPPRAFFDLADVEAATILFEMRHALPDSSSTITAPGSGFYLDSTIPEPDSSPLSSRITVPDYRGWEASGIKKLADYLACKDAALATSRQF